MTATELLNQRFKQEKQQNDQQFRQEWDQTSRRFGPPSANPQLEGARQRALSNLRKEQTERANAHIAGFNKRLQALKEVDSLIPNPDQAEEVKMRLTVSPDVERAMFQKPEQDILTEESKVQGRLNQVRAGLRRFGREAPGVQQEPVLGIFRRGKIKTQGGGVMVGQTTFDEATGKTKKTERNATPEEIKEWAQLTEDERRTMGYLQDIRKSDVMASRLRTAAMKSSRLGQGTFAQKAVEKEETGPKKLTTQIAMQYLHIYGDRQKAMAAALKDGYVE